MRRCFASRLEPKDSSRSSATLPPAFHVPDVRLADRHADALAKLLPLMVCGEESASMVFASMSELALPLPVTPLRSIAADELRHESLLSALRQALPTQPVDLRLQATLRRFFIGMADRDIGKHFARIVALDSAVCVLLGELRRGGRPLAGDMATDAVLRRIHGDEGRHVRIARQFAGAMISKTCAIDAAFGAREGLAQLMEHRADALDALQVDPSRMMRRLRVVPRGLFV